MARRQKAQGPDQAPEGVAGLSVPHLHRGQVHGDRADAGFDSRWREANAGQRTLKQGLPASLTGCKVRAAGGCYGARFKKPLESAAAWFWPLAFDGCGGNRFLLNIRSAGSTDLGLVRRWCNWRSYFGWGS